MKTQSNMMRLSGLLGLATTLVAFAAESPAQLEGKATSPANHSVKFVQHRVDKFRSEACCVADFNQDGKLDILAGENLYLAPDWKSVKIRTIKGSVDESGKGYRWDFANLALDVDGDGRPDLISVDWFEKRAVWFRNSGTAGGEWPLTVIEENGNFESADLWDLDGDGQAREVLPHVQRTVWYEVGKGPAGQKSLVTHVVSEKLLPFGGGVGDVNGDGRPDIIRPTAWFEAPADPRNGPWKEHALALGHKEEGKADHTAQILVYDVNGDGRNDLICSSAHEYGIFWYEQIRDGDEIRFKQHLIDNSWTQAHSLALGDLDGDGAPELVVGKRFMAHNGSDPEETAPLGLYYYQLRRQPAVTWTKHIISYNEGIGSGMNICLVDLDADGDLDVVVTGKWGGPAWFENQSKSPDKKILVYTRNFVTNGQGYVHDNIQSSVEALKTMGRENHFAVDVSADPKVFTDENLKQYKALVFSNSNNEAFENDTQREAFRRYLQAGGGFVGIHSASGSERNWPYYWSLVGGKFLRHPKFQKFIIRVKDSNHPATLGLPASFEWTDECYYHDHLNPDLHVLLVTDPAQLDDPDKATYPGDRFGDSMPLAWCHQFDGGREFYTALGHKKEDYANPLLARHILGGILWAMGEKETNLSR